MNLSQKSLYTTSNVLILIAFIVTIIVLINPEFYIYGMNDYFISQGNNFIYFIQLFSSQFIHGSMMHFLFNALFIYIFGNMVEKIIGYKKMIIFFIFSAVFIGISISYFGNGNTVGISGFAMALLSFYTLELYFKNNIEYKGGITAIIINIGIGFTPGISLLGHLSGAISGIIFYFIYKKYFQIKYITYENI